MWICPDCGKLAWTRALMTPRSRENHRPQGNTPPPNFACNSPPLNFARNSLTTLSNFEFISLEFCGFLEVPNLPDHRITCEIGGGLRWPAPTLRRIARSMLSPNGSRTHTNRHRNYWKFAICRRAQPTQQTNCDGVRTFVQMVCTQPLCFAIAWFLMRSKLLAERLIEHFGRDKL